jgi:hypothetical protein
MKRKSIILAAMAFSALGAVTSQGALLIGTSPITIDFNNLNTNFGGAYNSTGGSSVFPINTTVASAPVTIYSGTGGVEFTVGSTDFLPGGVYSNTGTYSNSNSFRALQNGSLSDLALGVKDSATRTFTLWLKNNTGATVPTWNVAYDVEQYSKGSSATTFSFSYSTNGTTFVTTGLSGAATVTANTSAPVDVNLASVISTSRTGVITQSIANTSDIYLRWTYTHIGGTSPHMGIDNIVITAVPEPSTALLGGLGLLALLRRRR